MGAKQSATKFPEPVRYSTFDNSLDFTCIIENRLEALRVRRAASLILSLVATGLTLLAISTPCWFSNAKQHYTGGIFVECQNNKCHPTDIVPYLSLIEGVAVLMALLITTGQLLSLALCRKTFTDTVIVVWNINSFIFLFVGLNCLLMVIGVTVHASQSDLISRRMFSFSYFLAWPGALTSIAKGCLDFHLCHKFTQITHTSRTIIRNFSREDSSQPTCSGAYVESNAAH